MKTTKYRYLLLLILITAATLAAIQSIAQADSRPVRLSIATEKSDYSLGDVIGLRFEVENMSARPIDAVDPNVLVGNTKLYVSGDGQNYVEYAGPHWGAVNGRNKPRKLEAHGVLVTEATMLFNRSIPTDHLTPLYAMRIKKERLDSEFAMLEPGHYWLKASYRNGNETVRSEPIEIEVTTPVGTDAAVWEQIKTDGAFAWFLQTGEVNYSSGTKEAEMFVDKLERIGSEFPDTNLGGRLTERLVRYNRNLESLHRTTAERLDGK